MCFGLDKSKTNVKLWCPKNRTGQSSLSSFCTSEGTDTFSSWKLSHSLSSPKWRNSQNIPVIPAQLYILHAIWVPCEKFTETPNVLPALLSREEERLIEKCNLNPWSYACLCVLLKIACPQGLRVSPRSFL